MIKKLPKPQGTRHTTADSRNQNEPSILGNASYPRSIDRLINSKNPNSIRFQLLASNRFVFFVFEGRGGYVLEGIFFLTLTTQIARTQRFRKHAKSANKHNSQTRKPKPHQQHKPKQQLVLAPFRGQSCFLCIQIGEVSC